MKLKPMRFACSLVIATFAGSLHAEAESSRIFWSPSGTNVGSPAIRAYIGSSDVTAMAAGNGGVLTAFAGTGLGYRIHVSPNGENLGGGPVVYDGSSPVIAVVAYKGGVLTAFANCGPYNGPTDGAPTGPVAACVHLSENGVALGAGTRVYGGSSPVTAMVAYKDKVLTAFLNCGSYPGPTDGAPTGPAAACVHLSENGRAVGGGTRVYGGSSPVTAMAAYKDGVLTAFLTCGSYPGPTDGAPTGPAAACVHLSENGRAVGGGTRVYGGSSRVGAMAAYKDGVLTAFLNCGPYNGPTDGAPTGPAAACVHLSENGRAVGGGTRVYGGSTVVRAMLAYNGGVFTAFQSDDGRPRCGGIGDFACNLIQVIGTAVEQARKVGRDIDEMRLKLLASVISGPALEQWLKASRDSAINGAMAMPPEMRRALEGFYAPGLMDKVRFKIGDGGALNLANNSIRVGNADAVTLIDVIIFRGPSEAACPSIWAHEMKHVQQFDEWGVHSFAVQYAQSYNSVEDPAYAIGAQYHQANPQRC